MLHCDLVIVSPYLSCEFAEYAHTWFQAGHFSFVYDGFAEKTGTNCCAVKYQVFQIFIHHPAKPVAAIVFHTYL